MSSFLKRWWWVWLVLAVGLGLWRLRFDVDVLDLLPSDEPTVQGLKLYEKHFTNARELVVSLRAPNPDQAEKLDLARSVGTLSLVLRNQVDADTLATAGATKLTLLGASAPVPASAPVAAPQPTRVKYVSRAPVKRDCIGVLSGVSGSQECF